MPFDKICLGANVPEQKEYPEGGFCCGSWCDGILPALKICERFKVDRKKVKKMAQENRPDGTEKAACFAYPQGGR